MSQIAARFTRVRTTATTTPPDATGDEKKSAGLFVITEYDGSLTYGVPFIAVRKYSRKATLVPSSVGTEAATMVPFRSTTATDSYSGERAAAAGHATRGGRRSAPGRGTGLRIPEVCRVADDVRQLRDKNDVAEPAGEVRVDG